MHIVSLSIAKRPKNYGILCPLHNRKAAQSVHALQSQFVDLEFKTSGDLSTFIGEIEVVNKQFEDHGKAFAKDVVMSKFTHQLV